MKTGVQPPVGLAAAGAADGGVQMRVGPRGSVLSMTTPSAVSLNRQVCTAEMPRRRPSQITSRPGPQRTTRGST